LTALAISCKAIKGGSFLCADSYCSRYRPRVNATVART
jgi:hypothetical protein